MQLPCTYADLIIHMSEKKSVIRNFPTTHFIMKPLLENIFPIKCVVISSAARKKQYLAVIKDIRDSVWTAIRRGIFFFKKNHQHYKLIVKFGENVLQNSFLCFPPTDGQKRPVPATVTHVPPAARSYVYSATTSAARELLQREGGLGMWSDSSRQNKMPEGKGSCCHVESGLNWGIWCLHVRCCTLLAWTLDTEVERQSLCLGIGPCSVPGKENWLGK